jgi:long-chain acyl-CoA synthetase
LLADKKVLTLFEGEIKKQCEAAALNKFEYPAKFTLTETMFTQENDLLTPTFKLKRNEAKNYFIKEIKQMYGGVKLQGEDA